LNSTGCPLELKLVACCFAVLAVAFAFVVFVVPRKGTCGALAADINALTACDVELTEVWDDSLVRDVSSLSWFNKLDVCLIPDEW